MSYKRITAIAGPMFSGKSSELIRICHREQIAKRPVQVFKPSADTRTGSATTSTHLNQEFPATIIPSDDPWAICEQAEEFGLIGIEEVQFFSQEIVEVVMDLAERGHKVVVVGLDLDYRGRPFGPMPSLLALADEVVKLTAICVICGDEATRTQRLSQSDKLVEIGNGESYAARCRVHHTF